MKIGFIAENDLARLEADARFCADQGLNGLEFNHWGGFSELTVEYIEAARAVLDKYRIGCSSLGLWGWNHTSTDEAERAAALAQFDRLVDFGGRLGAKVLITGGGNRPGAGLAANVDAFEQYIAPYLPRISAGGHKLALYAVHGNTFTDSPEAYTALWQRFPEVGIKCDPANLHHAGWDYIEFLWRHGGRITHMHIKEHLYHAGALIAQPAAGMGSIHWGQVFCFLHEHCYQGYLVIEPHGERWTRDDLRYRGVTLSTRYIEQFLT